MQNQPMLKLVYETDSYELNKAIVVKIGISNWINFLKKLIELVHCLFKIGNIIKIAYTFVRKLIYQE